MSIAVGMIVAFYALVHILKIEAYPFYMFGMYSEPMQDPDYQCYSIIVDGKNINEKHLDYRHYTYIMNTVAQYDGILRNDMLHPEAEFISKLTEHSGLSKKTLQAPLQSPHFYDKEGLKSSMKDWLDKTFKSKNVQIFKNSYKWKTENFPLLTNQEIIYEVDQ